jgi:hypothetical protein
MAWQKQHGVSKTTVNYAIRLVEAEPDEDAVARMSIKEALDHYGIRRRTVSTAGGNGRPRRTPPSPSRGRVEDPLSTLRRALDVLEDLADTLLWDDVTPEHPDKMCGVLDQIIELAPTVRGYAKKKIGGSKDPGCRARGRTASASTTSVG